MNVERLNSMLYDILEHDTLTHLKAFQTTFAQNIATPNQPNADLYLSAHASLKEALGESLSNHFSPSHRKWLDSIGGSKFVGNKLMSALEQIIEENSAVPGQAVTKVREHIEEAINFIEVVSATNKNLNSLGVKYDYTKDNEYEVGILLPSGLFKGELECLEKEFNKINRHFKVFGELAGGDTASPTIRCVSSGSFEIFLNALPDVADCISVAIERIVFLYVAIINIRGHRKSLKEQKVPAKVLKSIEQHEKNKVNEGIEEIAEFLNKEYSKSKDDKELFSKLRMALKYLIKRIDQGVDFEVTPPNVDAPAEDASTDDKKSHEGLKKSISKLQERSKAIRELPKRTQPILALHEINSIDDCDEDDGKSSQD